MSIINRIWERYLLKELFKVFFLFLSCFFFLYSLVDYSLHMQDFIIDKRIQISHIANYYLFQFIKRADLLVPLALLVSTLKVLLTINARGEFIALQASGLAANKILRPFFLVGLLCALFNLASAELFLPSSLNHLDRFREKHFKHSRHGNRKEPVHVVFLKDRSKIVYQTEDRQRKLYLDVFWIRSVDEIWRMSTLSTDATNPVGSYVDRLKRNSEGNFEKMQSFDQYHFNQFRWQADPSGKGYTPLENRKISQLLRILLQKAKATSYEYPQALTQFLFKISMPFLAMLVIAAASPFCLRHSRNLPFFFIYAIALFGFIAFFAMMDAAVILGENLVVSPYVAILLPLALSWIFFGYNYHKTMKGSL
jgi:lipopolysaccharide export system permease protein